MFRLLIILPLLLATYSAYAVDIPKTNGECVVMCNQYFPGGGPVTPPVTPPSTSKPYPGKVIFDNTSDQGEAPYYGTACVIIAPGMAKVTLDGETAAKGNQYRGLDVWRFLKIGSEYTRPLSFVFTDPSGQVFTFIAGSTNPGTGPVPAGSPTNISGHSILWKPVADSGGDLVVLTHRSYGKTTVRVLDMNKNVIETGTFVYFSNPDRATYRFKRGGAEFPRPCILQVGDKLFTVPDGSKRYE